jgi:uncharacterized protein (DUF58 family)
VPQRFPAPFRTLLHDLLARGGRMRAGRVDRQRARRSVLSHSGTFVGHRPYVHGDDPRRIDWAACARTGELFVKQFEEEQRRTATLVLDLSASLLVGEPPRRLAALRLAAVVGGLARQLDGVTVVAPGAGGGALATFTGAGDLDALLRHLDELPVVPGAPDAAIPLVLSRGMSGHLHWISDFADPAAFELPIAALRRRGARLTGWLPALPEDREVPRQGYVQVRDPEDGSVLAVALDGALAAEMRRQLALLQRRQDRLFAQFGCPLVRWPAPAETEFGAAAWQEIVAWCAR